jgi:hypothetical protein
MESFKDFGSYRLVTKTHILAYFRPTHWPSIKIKVITSMKSKQIFPRTFLGSSLFSSPSKAPGEKPFSGVFSYLRSHRGVKLIRVRASSYYQTKFLSEGGVEEGVVFPKGGLRIVYPPE